LPSTSAASCGLAISDTDRNGASGDFTAPANDFRIGRVHFIQDREINNGTTMGVEALDDPVSVKQIHFCQQAIAPAADGLNAEALVHRPADLFPDCRAADAETGSKRLTRVNLAVRQKAKNCSGFHEGMPACLNLSGRD
jgi:hypothetical protein